jgi:hypothetical protein
MTYMEIGRKKKCSYTGWNSATLDKGGLEFI